MSRTGVRVHVRRHGAGQFVATATLPDEDSPHFSSDPETDPDVAACAAKAWARIHGLTVRVVTLEAGIRGLALAGDDHWELP